MVWTLTDFVRESNRIAGIHREPTAGEMDATRDFLALSEVTLADIAWLVSGFVVDWPTKIRHT